MDNKYIKINSDYSPDAYLKIIRTVDSDIIFKVCGTGEMRIATSGGQFHGEKLVAISRAIDSLIEALEMPETVPEPDDTSPCKGCAYRGCCGMMQFDTSGMSEEEIFREHCCGCPCGDGCECNRESGCGNWSEEVE